MFVFALIALSLTAAAYMAEIIRSGLLAVAQGQTEAAYTIGMTSFQALHRIVLPQATMASLPSLCNLVVGVLHGSSLLYLVSVREVTGTAMVIASREWKFIESYVAVAILYWGVTLLLERGMLTSERRWNKRIQGRIS
jgi:L-cystine transport system permease protein